VFTDTTLIGLDIGNHTIKMVEIFHEIENKTPIFKLHTFGQAQHSLNLNGYWDSSILRQLSILIDSIMKQGNFSGVKTVMSVQSRDVYVTTMDFDSEWNKSQIQKEIDRQSPYFLPMAPEDMRLSWSIVTNDPHMSSYTGKQRAIINALPETVVANSKNILEHINLDGVSLENQVLSQIRSALRPDSGNTILMDIGGDQTTFSMVVDGQLRASSHITTGGNSVTKSLADSLGVDLPIADYFKKDIGLVNLFQIPGPVTEIYKVIKSELITFCELNRKVSQPPQKVVITGGSVALPGIIDYFKKDFSTPVFVANCLRGVRVQPEIRPYILPSVNQFSTAIGLAMKEGF
jgi:cell division ATPase FtsA